MKSSDIQDYKNLGYPPHLVLILSTALHIAQADEEHIYSSLSSSSENLYLCSDPHNPLVG